MRYLLGTVIGFALLAFGLTCLCYGIAQAIEIGECGTDRYGRSIGPACPTGTGGMIVMMVGGAFVAIFGTGFLSMRGKGLGGFGMGIAVGQLIFWLGAIVAGGISVYFALTDLHEDDTRPGMEVVYAVCGTLLFFAVIGAFIGGRDKSKQSATGPWGRPAGPAAAIPGMSGMPGAATASNPFGAPPPPPSAGAFGSPPPPPSSYGSESAASAFGTTTPQEAAAAFGAPPTPAPAATPPNADVYAKLDQLAQLHRSGALSDAEFEDAKARILRNI